MLLQIVFGSCSINGCWFKLSALNLKHMYARICSFNLGGKWFRHTKFDAAWMLFLCKQHPNNNLNHPKFLKILKKLGLHYWVEFAYKFHGAASALDDQISHVANDVSCEAKIEEHVEDDEDHL